MEWKCGTEPTVPTKNNINILLNYTDSTSVPPKFNSYKNLLISKSTKIIILKADTGASRNYIWDKYTIILNNIQPTTTGPQVRLPENTVIQTKLYSYLTQSMLPPETTQAHTYPNLNIASLIPIGQLYDSDCSALIKKMTSTFSTQTKILYSMENRIHVMYFGM